MAETENLVLEHLRAMRGDIARLTDAVTTLSTEMRAIRQLRSGAMTLQKHDHDDIAALKHRVERRLELTE